MLQNYMLVAFGGAIGSVARFQIYALLRGGDFPYATLLVNVAGSFAIGLVMAILQQRAGAEAMRLFLVVGVLGGFTTFSAFSLETMTLLQAGYWMKAAANVVFSVGVCVAAAFAGFGMYNK